MVASAAALTNLISSVEGAQPITLGNILTAHRILMREDAAEALYAGRVRDMQNWIGGSNYSPRNALYVPPPPEMLDAYLADLLAFANRDDVPALVQAAIVHAQFESIHPFTDGSGRIGRALINTVLRCRGVTSTVVVPLASALVAQRDTYFGVLQAYRQGDAGPLIRSFAHAALVAAVESGVTAQHLADLLADWHSQYRESLGSHPRAGSAAHRILDELLNLPFFTAEEMEERVGLSTTSVYAAIEKMAQAGILRPLTARQRNQVWGADAVVDELEDLGVRVSSQAATDPAWRRIQGEIRSRNAPGA